MVRLAIVTLLGCLALPVAAQTEYETTRDPAMRRLGAQLQAGQLDAARRDLATYVEANPGDAVMQYNLACLAAVAGDTLAALDRLELAFAAGYRDLDRALEDPDLLLLRDDPRLAALLDATRAHRLARMLAAEVFLEEGTWSAPLVLAPDPFGPGPDAAPGSLRARFDVRELTLEITPPPAGADEALITVVVPRSLEQDESERWFEFSARPMSDQGLVIRQRRHGRAEPAATGGHVATDGDIVTVTIPWPDLHPYHPPVSLTLGLNVLLRREAGRAPADRWSLVADPYAGSSVQPWRRFAPLVLDPGPAPEPYLAGRLDTYLVVGDSLSAELGIQGLPPGPATLTRSLTGRPDTTVTLVLEGELDYLTLDLRLPPPERASWFDVAARLTTADGTELRWRDRGVAFPPDWFVVQNERVARVPELERPIVQYHLFRTLRGQQRVHPHDDPTALERSAQRAVAMLRMAESSGSVLPDTASVIEGAFPRGNDALQSCWLALPEGRWRRDGTVVVVAVDDRGLVERLARDLSDRRPEHDRRSYAVLALATAPGQEPQAAAVVAGAGAWAEALLGTRVVRWVGAGAAAGAVNVLHGPDAEHGDRLLLLGRPLDRALPELPVTHTVDDDTPLEPAAMAARIRSWR